MTIKYLKNILLLVLFSNLNTTIAQRSIYDRVIINYLQYPRVLLDSQYHTYSIDANVPDYMGGNYIANIISYDVQGLKKTASSGDIQILLNYPYFTEFARPTQEAQVYSTKVNGRDTTYNYKAQDSVLCLKITRVYILRI